MANLSTIGLNLIDEVIIISDKEAYAMAGEAAKKEGWRKKNELMEISIRKTLWRI